MAALPDTFAVRLRRLREQVGLSPSQLADAAGMPRPVYSRIEAGTRQPSWRTLRKLAAALEVSLAAFDGCE